jgi:hypothetical protein
MQELVAEHRLQHGPFHRSPLLEQVVLRMHALGDLMPAALQHQAAGGGEMNADVGAVQLFLNDQRGIGDEGLRFATAEVFIVISAARAEQMRRARIFEKSSRAAPIVHPSIPTGDPGVNRE